MKDNLPEIKRTAKPSGQIWPIVSICPLAYKMANHIYIFIQSPAGKYFSVIHQFESLLDLFNEIQCFFLTPFRR